MTRSSKEPLIELDLEIERTLRSLRNSLKENTCFSDSSLHSSSSLYLFDHTLIFDNMAAVMNEDEQHVNGNDNRNENHDENNVPLVNEEERSIREVIAPNDNMNYSYAYFPDDEFNFQIKPSLLQNLPKFYGLTGEDPNRHLQDLYMVCHSMKPLRSNTEEVMWKSFVFSLEGKAREWFLLQPQHIRCTSWADLRRAFLDKYFPATRGASLRKEIMGIKQKSEENLYEYWARFQSLLVKLPHHTIPKEHLIQYFHEGLLPLERRNVDATAGGSLLDMNASRAWALLDKMANLEQQYTPSEREAKSVQEAPNMLSRDVRELQAQIAVLTKSIGQVTSQQSSQVNNMGVSNALVASSCSICQSNMHISSNFPLKEEA